MSLLVIYAIFAIATALTAIYELTLPVLSLRKQENKPMQSIILLLITFFLVYLLIAPLVFFSCIIPSWGDAFKKYLYRGLFEGE